MTQFNALHRVAHYNKLQTTASNTVSLSNSKSSFGSILANILLATFAITKLTFSIIDVIVFQMVRVIIRTSIKLHNKTAAYKKNQLDEQEVMRQVGPEVKKLVHTFVKGVEKSPDKAIWLQKKFQKDLVETLEAISSEFDLELNVHKLAAVIIAYQAPAMKAALDYARKNQGLEDPPAKQDILALKDVSVINDKLKEAVLEENRSGRYKRY